MDGENKYIWGDWINFSEMEDVPSEKEQSIENNIDDWTDWGISEDTKAVTQVEPSKVDNISNLYAENVANNHMPWDDWEDDYIENETPREKTFQEKLYDFDPKSELKESEIEFIKTLYIQNDELLDTLNPDLLKSKYMQLFSVEQLGKMACDTDFQKKLLSFNNEQYKIFSECCKNINERGNDWALAINTLADGVKKTQFAELVNDVYQHKEFSIENLTHLLQCDDNYFNIKSVEQLHNFQAIKTNVCKQILEDPNNLDNLSDSIKEMDALERIKFAKCEQEYGISLIHAKLLCQKYGWCILNSGEKIGDNQTHEMLVNLISIIKANHVEDILCVRSSEKSKFDNKSFREIDAQLRRTFTSMYNSSFYHPQQENFLEFESFEGKQVPVYDAGVEFMMCTHVVGAFSTSNEGDGSYKDKWNASKIQSHVFCTRLVSNEAVEIASNKDNTVCYGFTDFSQDAIVASAPWDMASISYNKRFDTIGEMDKAKKMTGCEGSGARFLPPKEQINNTRTNGSETNWDRFDDIDTRKQPSYLVYIADNTDTSQYKETYSYSETIKAASEFGIPIVVIDRKKVLDNEHKQIDKMMREYLETHDVKIMRDIIQRFENNRTTGFSQTCAKLYESEFPLLSSEKGDFKSLQDIATTLLETNPKNAQSLVDVLSSEVVKSPNNHNEFCEIIYGIKDKCPTVRIDLNTHLENDLGITKDFRLPQKVGPYSYKSFHKKRMDELRNKCQKNETAPINGEQTTRSIVELRGISPTAKAPCRPQTIKIDPNTLRLYQDKILKSN